MSDEKENAVGAKVLAAERCVAAVMEQRPGWLNVTPTAVATAAISDRITPPVPSPVVLSLEQKVADAVFNAVEERWSFNAISRDVIAMVADDIEAAINNAAKSAFADTFDDPAAVRAGFMAAALIARSGGSR